MHTSPTASENYVKQQDRANARHVVACIDRADNAQKIVPHAMEVARVLGVPTTFLQILETSPSRNLCPDPIEWNIIRHEARNALQRLARAHTEAGIALELAEGQAAAEICRWTKEQPTELLVLGACQKDRGRNQGIGNIARGVLENATGSVLIVPLGDQSALTPSYKKILVPLDCSSWSESVLPFAIRMARAAEAQLVLAHVVPVPEITETEPLEAEDLALRKQVVDRNERVARTYLARIQRYAMEQGIRVRTAIARAEDVRSGLANLIRRERADLVALSPRGHGRGHTSHLPYGNVAAYLLTHPSTPTLLVRSNGITNKAYSTAKHGLGHSPAASLTI